MFTAKVMMSAMKCDLSVTVEGVLSEDTLDIFLSKVSQAATSAYGNAVAELCDRVLADGNGTRIESDQQFRIALQAGRYFQGLIFAVVRRSS